MLTKRELLQIAVYSIIAFVGFITMYLLSIFFIVWVGGVLY